MAQLTDDLRERLPGPDDVAFYQEHGWWISPPVLDATALDLLRFGVERYFAGERDWSLPVVLGADWEPADGAVLRQNDFVSLQIQDLFDFIRHPLLAAMAARLSGARSVRLFHDQLIVKPAGGELAACGVGWHTDRAYWGTCTSTRMLTAWIPLQDVSARTGTMRVIDRSHRWPGAEALRHFHERDVDAVRDRIAAPGRWEEVAYELKGGQVAFHHCRTIHGSRENRAPVPRVAWAVHFQDEENRWQPVLNADGTVTPHTNELLCARDPDGAPDYADPTVCPELWNEAWVNDEPS